MTATASPSPSPPPAATTSSVGDPFGAQPNVPGVAPGGGRNGLKAHILLGMAPDYPPYTSWTSTVPVDLGGFNKGFADLMEPTCGIKVEMILAPWSGCWTAKPSSIYFSNVNEYAGLEIMEGKVHGCTAYTHTVGERGLSLEFTDSILGGLKRAGILTRLNAGVPVVSPTTYNFTGINIGMGHAAARTLHLPCANSTAG